MATPRAGRSRPSDLDERFAHFPQLADIADHRQEECAAAHRRRRASIAASCASSSLRSLERETDGAQSEEDGLWRSARPVDAGQRLGDLLAADYRAYAR